MTIGVSLLCSLDGISPRIMSNIGGLHQMLGLHEHILTAVPRDSITSLPEYESTNKTGASFDTPCGRRLVFSSFLTFFLHGYVIVMLKAHTYCLCFSHLFFPDQTC